MNDRVTVEPMKSCENTDAGQIYLMVQFVGFLTDAARARVLSPTRQRCRVHFQRNAPAHADKNSRSIRRKNDPPDGFPARLILSRH
ncbi:hypothetical protein, partial [Rhodobacter capsulatus]|uniref:hypothetical protein n=1 Tax=Rhodobacter capsulatus TaxID=1061 RepID=UPI00373FC98B